MTGALALLLALAIAEPVGARAGEADSPADASRSRPGIGARAGEADSPADASRSRPGIGAGAQSPVQPIDEAGATTEASQAPPTASAARSGVGPRDETRAMRLGFVNGFGVGLFGDLNNPVPSYRIGVDFGFPTGRAARIHVDLSYQTLNGYSGLRAAPFSIGYSFPISVPEGFGLEIEVVAEIIQAEVLFGDPGFSIALGSGLRGQVVGRYGAIFGALTPIGVDVRYAYGVESVGVKTGIGTSWPFTLVLGVEL